MYSGGGATWPVEFRSPELRSPENKLSILLLNNTKYCELFFCIDTGLENGWPKSKSYILSSIRGGGQKSEY